MKIHSVKFNFIMNFIMSASSIVFPLITFPYISRVLMATGNGKVATASAVITYFNMFAQLGIPTYGICACAKVRDDKEALSRTIHELLIINLIMSAFTYFVLGICLVTVPRFQTEKTLFSIVSTTILFNAVGVAL